MEADASAVPGARPAVRGRATDPDAELVAAAQADPAQFRALYQHYFPRIHGYVRVRIADRAASEDVTSTIFLTALAQLGSFRGEGLFAAWLFRIAQNAVYRTGRQPFPRDVPQDGDAEDGLAALPDPAPGPEAQLLAGERRAALRALLATLTPDQQHLLALRFGADLSTAEIGRVLGKSGVAVRVSLYRLLRQLHQRYHYED